MCTCVEEKEENTPQGPKEKLKIVGTCEIETFKQKMVIV